MDTSLSPPPDIYNHLRAILAGKASPSDIWPASSPSRASQAPSLAAIIIDLYSTLSTMSPLSAADSSAKVVGLMVEHGLTKERLLRIPFGIALPLMAAVKTCQSSPSASWSPAAFKLIRRPDLAPPAAAREPHATSTVRSCTRAPCRSPRLTPRTSVLLSAAVRASVDPDARGPALGTQGCRHGRVCQSLAPLRLRPAARGGRPAAVDDAGVDLQAPR